ncbi:hypothetical protein M427DRAFT_131796 [Gonapodya prolifera JEL478]|uniref:Uncharacterized protein n=1 Tax=Gonapodya prolifera (strain JEL478) TaxID=1344416 RepID=A0A139ASX7_GONPJ|nr:hypothetical protein M427DRAFT_131796 [Gonapodya prolifera JEL478]|eukprot:KXS19836.1 hypothetical protein M427DRAFT_131796 [Gonapodya prolifera JEL478]
MPNPDIVPSSPSPALRPATSSPGPSTNSWAGPSAPMAANSPPLPLTPNGSLHHSGINHPASSTITSRLGSSASTRRSDDPLVSMVAIERCETIPVLVMGSRPRSNVGSGSSPSLGRSLPVLGRSVVALPVSAAVPAVPAVFARPIGAETVSLLSDDTWPGAIG